MPSKAGRVKYKELKQGQTIYYVHALGENSFIWKYMVMSRPVCEKWKYGEGFYDFIMAKWFTRNGYVTEKDFLSLLDCNVIQNTYNEHAIFYKKKAAERYLEQCLNDKKYYHLHEQEESWPQC